MSDLYKNKYRKDSFRLQNFDYGSNAKYFVTICTHNQKCFFGKIENTRLHLSEIGEIALANWEKITLQFDYVILHHFIVMPNHIHGIIEIDKPDKPQSITPPLSIDLNAKPIGGITGKNNPMIDDNLGRIIRWYKGRTTFDCRKINSTFKWHSSFHDHIIRNNNDYARIAEYIENNPLVWKEDCFYE